jgi:AcrR family transcriptional regulator
VTPAASRSRLPRAERERQMLATAHALFAARGYAAVTMDEVAAEVGVTKPLLYTYFGNKERIYLECMKPAGAALEQTVLEAIEGTTTPTDALRSGIHAFFAFIDADRNAWRVLFD